GYDFNTAERMIGVSLAGAPQHQAPMVDEPPASSVGGAHGPEHQGMKPRRPADGRPGFGVRGSCSTSLERGVDEQLAVWRQVAFVFVNAPAKPGAGDEVVAVGVP